MKFAPQEVRTYFITTVTANRRRIFQVTETAELMLDTLQNLSQTESVRIARLRIMPDHLHLLVTPAFDVSLEKALQFIKGGFSFRLKSKREVWERGFNEVQIRNAEKFDACRRYIEENPLRAGSAGSAEEYMYSSACLRNEVDPLPNHFRS